MRSEGLGIEPLPEVWQPDAAVGSRWRGLTSALKTLPLYSALYEAPNGEVFVPGPLVRSYFLDPRGTGRWRDGPRRVHTRARDYGSSAIYAPGKILIVGGAEPHEPGDEDGGDHRSERVAPGVAVHGIHGVRAPTHECDDPSRRNGARDRRIERPDQ
jgi:hypothetical protein